MTASSLHFVDETHVKLDEKLSTSGYTNEYVLKKLYDGKLKELLGNNKVNKITAHPLFSNLAKGFCSYVFKIIIQWTTEHGNQTFSSIMKLPTAENWNSLKAVEVTKEIEEINKENIRHFHNIEVEAYELMKNLKDFPKPEAYYLERADLENPGMIIMEDFSGKVTTLGIYYSVSKQLCLNLAKHMAAFHAYIEFLPDQSWRNKYSNMLSRPNVEDVWRTAIYPLANCEQDKELAEKCKILLEIDKLKMGMYCLETCAKEIGCSTLNQGDMWTNNMLIGLSEDGSVSDQILAVIDYQTLFEGNPMFDIARFLGSCADGDIRRECEREVVDLYYNLLAENYEKHGTKPKFTREQAHDLYDLALVHEAYLMALFIVFPTNKVEEARFKKLALRLKLLLDDVFLTIDKYNFRERFKLKK